MNNLEGQFLSKATSLFGNEDGTRWWEQNKALLTHPLFLQGTVVFYTEDITNFQKILQHLHADEHTVWAHPHPDFGNCFGVYIVRQGCHIIYQGRSVEHVKKYLGIKAAL